MSKHHSLWEKLNQRQQATLTAIYHTEQQQESAQKQAWHKGLSRDPASVWRNLQYYFEPTGHETLLHRLLRQANVVDQGLGSTLRVLEGHQLIECNYRQSELISIKLTTTGRAVARAGLGESAPKKPPKGQLKPRQWEALVRAYLSGENGIDNNTSSDDYAGFSWRWTWLRLRDYHGTEEGLVKEVGYWNQGKYSTKLVITLSGIEFYKKQWEQYRALYPDVNAPKPDDVT
ncbi:hypothetical protein H6G80_35555 [Nostoc sp. FACHB-87]|uniref:hypothetical protein n=1 Tax=Nostocaceae TaxID=1162 RepID=UPI001684F872|nr:MULTISPECIES: hypothetical protein [Nostocaceae]MBD2459333.1 hypothetical protein [Nostoc sp. FACHB-87]MBD2480336.1 hypothetical protein [Anabaena sp. FACHB-83]